MIPETYKKIIKISFPIMIGFFIEAVYSLTDAFFLGKLGSAEISAPSIALTIFRFFVIFGLSLSGAGTTLIAQAKGQNDEKKMKFYLGQMTILVLSISIGLSIAGIFSSKWILKLLATPDEVFKYVHGYLTIILLGTPFMFGFFILQSSFNAIGDTITPFWIHLGGIAINFILDPVLIFGVWIFPKLGVNGAAIATILSQGITFVLAFNILIKGKNGLRLEYWAIKPDKKILYLLIKIGLPASIGNGLSSLGFTFLQGIVNIFGKSLIAAYGIGYNVISFCDLPARGISTATSVLTGQAIGSKNNKQISRILKCGIVLCIAIMGPPLILSFFFGGNIIQLFVNDFDAIAAGKLMFKIITPSILAFGIFLVITGVFYAAGDTKIVMFLSIIRIWILRIPLALFLINYLKLGSISIWIVMFASNIITIIIGILYYFSGRWKNALRVI